MREEAVKLESLLGYQLKHLQTALRSRMDETLRPLELTTPQYNCLEQLRRRPGASNSELARGAFVTRQTMNTLLRGLQERGLITRPAKAEPAAPCPLASPRQALRRSIRRSPASRRSLLAWSHRSTKRLGRWSPRRSADASRPSKSRKKPKKAEAT